jgi:hypothetical protein
VNALFLLSEDRLKFNELNEGDTANNRSIHKWNEYLIKPLVDNLIAGIQCAIQNLEVKDNQSFIDYFWPVDTSNSYFNDFENEFYKQICLNQTLNFYPILPDPMDFKQQLFAPLKHAIFLDLNFEEDKKLNELAFKVLNDWKLSKLHLIQLPARYLIKIKSCLANSINLVDKTEFFKSYLINFKKQIESDEYQPLLAYYILNSEFAEIINQSACIPTQGNEFRFINELLDPTENQFYKKIFKADPNRFPCDDLCKSRKIMSSALFSSGLMNIETIPNQVLIELLESIDVNSQSLSHNLLQFLSELLKIRDGQFHEELVDSIQNTKWLFAKPRPRNWRFKWFADETEDKIFKPSDLFMDSVQTLIGSSVPLFDSSQLASDETDFLDILALNSSQTDVIKYSIDTIRMFSNEKKNPAMAIFFNEFVDYLKKYTSEDSNRFNYLKSALHGLNWVYCNEKNRPVESFAFNVQNQIEPYLLKLPESYSSEPSTRLFFQNIGVKDYGSIEFLLSKLTEIREKFCGQATPSPIDKSSFHECKNIVEEIIYIDENNDSDQTSLEDFVKDSKEKKIFLPDVDFIMRDLNQLCNDDVLASSTVANLSTGLYIVHKELTRSDKFGIKAHRKRVFDSIGKPFGQKENLVNRIKKILKEYSSKISIFKGECFAFTRFEINFPSDCAA